MTSETADAIATITLMAALADGTRCDAERQALDAHFRDAGVDQGGIYTRVLLKQTTLVEQIGRIPDAGDRRLAYESARAVCAADGTLSPGEQEFLTELRRLLGLGDTHAFDAESVAIETAPLASVEPSVAGRSDPSPDVSGMILNYAILTGAIELLPQTLATAAIIPLQGKMVYRIGRRHGCSLDRGHIREFIAVLGVSATGQVIEGMARKFLGGIFGSIGKFGGKGVGKMAKTAASAGTGVVITFATTYAIGRVADIYYANNRSIAVADLKQRFSSEVESAKSLYTNYAPQIQQRSQTLDMGDVLNMVRGGA